MDLVHVTVSVRGESGEFIDPVLEITGHLLVPYKPQTGRYAAVGQTLVHVGDRGVDQRDHRVLATLFKSRVRGVHHHHIDAPAAVEVRRATRIAQAAACSGTGNAGGRGARMGVRVQPHAGRGGMDNRRGRGARAGAARPAGRARSAGHFTQREGTIGDQFHDHHTSLLEVLEQEVECILVSGQNEL